MSWKDWFRKKKVLPKKEVLDLTGQCLVELFGIGGRIDWKNSPVICKTCGATVILSGLSTVVSHEFITYLGRYDKLELDGVYVCLECGSRNVYMFHQCGAQPIGFFMEEHTRYEEPAQIEKS